MVLPFHCGNHSLRASAFLRQSQPPGFCLSAALAASRARAYLAAKTNQFLVTSTYPTQPSLIRVVYACLHAVCVRGMLMMYACLHAVCVRGMLTWISFIERPLMYTYHADGDRHTACRTAGSGAIYMRKISPRPRAYSPRAYFSTVYMTVVRG